MVDFETTILTAMLNAAISGLCREGQLEIGVQEARKLKPDRKSAELYKLVIDIHDNAQDHY